MQTHQKKSFIFMGLVRCFNAAAFVALSAFYFGMFFLGKPVIDHVELVPLAPLVHAVAPHATFSGTAI
jgi:hypothetical protein